MPRKTKLDGFSLMPRHQSMIDELLATGEFMSKSQVVRDGISLLHKKHFPYYKAVGRKKEEKKDKLDELRTLPIDQYVKQVLQGDLESNPGFCHLQHKNNPMLVVDVPVAIVKNYLTRNEIWKSVNIALESERYFSLE